jgi:hypothetical protein
MQRSSLTDDHLEDILKMFASYVTPEYEMLPPKRDVISLIKFSTWLGKSQIFAFNGKRFFVFPRFIIKNKITEISYKIINKTSPPPSKSNLVARSCFLWKIWPLPLSELCRFAFKQWCSVCPCKLLGFHCDLPDWRHLFEIRTDVPRELSTWLWS